MECCCCKLPAGVEGEFMNDERILEWSNGARDDCECCESWVDEE